MKKLIYLFLALLLPGLVFVFLKYGGSNRFDIPVYYEEGVSNLPGSCTKPPSGPYRLPDSLWQHTQNRRNVANVMIFSSDELDGSTVAEAVQVEIGNKVTFTGESVLSVDSLTRVRWRTCTFMVDSPWQTVLFDSVGRIRGYYDLRSREEIDRLRVELKILVEQY